MGKEELIKQLKNLITNLESSTNENVTIANEYGDMVVGFKFIIHRDSDEIIVQEVPI